MNDVSHVATVFPSVKINNEWMKEWIVAIFSFCTIEKKQSLETTAPLFLQYVRQTSKANMIFFPPKLELLILLEEAVFHFGTFSELEGH